MEWNPPADRLPLAEALDWPLSQHLSVRIVHVPKAVHDTFPHSHLINLHQMIGKNVGIRRARSPFVLATNADVLIDDATVRYLRDRLMPDNFIRVDRFDIPNRLDGMSPDQALRFARKSATHIYSRFGVFDVAVGRHVITMGRFQWPAADLCTPQWHGSLGQCCGVSATSPVLSGRCSAMHCRCGVSIIARANWCTCVPVATSRCWQETEWCRLRGYLEFDGYPWHVDSILLYAALARGIKQVALPLASGLPYRAFKGVGLDS